MLSFMKIVLKTLLAACVLVLCGHTASAQKFGAIDTQALIMSMPERDSAAVKLQKFEEELSGQMETIQVEYNNKFTEYQKGQETMTAATKQLKEKELEDLGRRFQEFQQAAQQDYEKMQRELMAPVFTKAEEAVKKVSKSMGMTFVFDISAGGLIYRDESTVTDLLPLVKKELGITK